MKISTARRGRTTAAAAALLTTFALAAPAAHADPDHSATRTAFESYAGQAGPGTGLYVGDDSSSWNLSHGTGITLQNKPIQPNQHFRAASQTKVFTSSVVLQLVAEGKVDLDAPIERYLPGVVHGNYDGNAITVRMLLQHTSGIPSFGFLIVPGPWWTYQPTQMVEDALKQAPKFAPGKGWQYSNTGYILASMLIEKVTGHAVGEEITHRIITPLGLADTRFPKTGDKTVGGDAIHGYYNALLWVDISIVGEPSYLMGAGALISSMADLAKFDSALLAGKVVPPAQLAEMQRTVPGLPDSYGLGLSKHELSCGGTAWGHGGDVFGYSSITMATADGRHASMITNTMVTTPTTVSREAVIDAALCDGKD